jgi:hypothetical protein
MSPLTISHENNAVIMETLWACTSTPNPLVSFQFSSISPIPDREPITTTARKGRDTKGQAHSRSLGNLAVVFQIMKKRFCCPQIAIRGSTTELMDENPLRQMLSCVRVWRLFSRLPAHKSRPKSRSEPLITIPSRLNSKFPNFPLIRVVLS